MSFPQRLKELRDAHDFDQADVANHLGIARTTYASYEQGFRKPNFNTLTKIAELYSVSTDYLLASESINADKEKLSIIHRRIRELRKKRGLEQNELGELIGVKRESISAYENGYSKPSLEVLVKLSEFFNVSTDYLLGCENDTSRNDEIKELINDLYMLSDFMPRYMDISHRLNELVCGKND